MSVSFTVLLFCLSRQKEKSIEKNREYVINASKQLNKKKFNTLNASSFSMLNKKSSFKVSIYKSKSRKNFNFKLNL